MGAWTDLIKTLADVAGRVIPQYFNPSTDAMEPWEGSDGAANVQTRRFTSTVLAMASATISASATSGDLSTSVFSELALDVDITAIGGTSPTYTLSVNRKGADGVYYPIYTSSAQTATGKVSVSLGYGGKTNEAFGDVIQVVETLGGTSPTVTRSLSIIGK